MNEKSIKKREELKILKSLIKSINDLIFVLDENMIFQEYYQPDSENLVLSPEDFIGKSIESIGFPEPALGSIKKALTKTLESGDSTSVEYYIDMPEGRKWYDMRCSILDTDNQFRAFRLYRNSKSGVVCVARDITEEYNIRKGYEEGRNKLFITLKSIGDAVITTDAEGMISLMNPVAEKLTGWTESDAAGKNLEKVFKIINSKTGKKAVNPVAKTLKEGVTVGLENDTLLISRDGSKYQIEDSCSPIRSGKGKVLGAVLVFRDISEMYRRKELEADEARFHRLLSKLSENFIIVEREKFDGSVDDALEHLGTFFGADRSYVFRFSEDYSFMSNTHEWCAEGVESQKDNITDFPTSNIPWFMGEIRKLKPVHIPDIKLLPPEAENEKKEFQRQGIKSLVCVPMISANGNLTGFVGNDSVRKRSNCPENHISLLSLFADFLENAFIRFDMEKYLEESEKRYRELAKLSQTMVWEVDKDGRYTYVNEAVKELLGYSPEELVGKKFFYELAPPEERDILQGLENRLLTKDGRILWVLSSGFAVKGSGGEFLSYRGADINITESKEYQNKINESRERFKSLLLNIPGAPYHCRYDKDWTMIYLADEIENLTGYPPESFINNRERSYGSIIHTDDASGVERSIRRAIEADKPWEIEYRIVKRNGEISWVHEKGRGVKIDGDTAFLDGFIYDITDRKELELAILDNEKVLEDILESTVSGYWDWNLADNTEYLSPAFKSMFGYGDDEMENSPEAWQRIIFPEDLQKVLDNFARHVETGGREKFSNEVRYKHKNGSTVWVICSGRVIEWSSDGTPLRMVGCHVDITKRKAAEARALRISEEQEILLSNTEVMVWYLASEETYGAVNKSYAEFLGAEKKDIAYRNIRDVMPEDMASVCVEGNRKVFESGKKDLSDYIVKDPSGKERVISVNKVPKLLEDGRVDYVVCSGIDVTFQRKAQEETERAVRARESFIAMVSHELRTPLSVIIEGVNIVADGSCGEINEEQAKFLKLARNNVNRLGRLINDILDIQKMEEGMMKYNMEEGSIEERIISAVESVRPNAEKKGLELKTGVAEGLPLIVFDRDKIDQVMSNLLGNAVKFTPEGSISVSAELTEDSITVSVSDTGLGINPEDMPRLFNKFEQFKVQNQRTTGGTGLGLAICREIIEQHRGRIWAESEPGKGSAFIFTLPAKG